MRSKPIDPSPSPLTGAPLAHVTPAPDVRPHLLIDHLNAVGRLAGEFAASFGSDQTAYLAGLWHDVGKYRPRFQQIIRAENGFEAHIEGEHSRARDHSTAGALLAQSRRDLDRNLVAALAFCIAGHHAGLADASDLKARLLRSKDLLEEARQGGLPDSIAQAIAPPPKFVSRDSSPHGQRRAEMWIRFLFSALCDADFLDTEAFFDTTRSELRRGWSSLEALTPRLGAHLQRLEQQAPPSNVNRVRREVREACERAAPLPPGFFSLTVPTGGGKTLAAMTFALRHAEAHGLRRVVVALPYTAIIEQNADVYRRALGDDAVLEHHSASDTAQESPRSRIACENWDAPVIVTTTVQLLESLLANRPSACRKLHRLAGSIIVLDEAQTLPPGRLAPILDVLQALVSDYGASVVISTATQPAFSSALLPDDIRLPNVREIVPPPLRLFERLRRVSVRWPDVSAGAPPTSYAELVAELMKETGALAIVHLRKDARELTSLLDEAIGSPSTVHLSALMYPAHRARVLGEVTARRRCGEPARVVSTQLVEAGVDIDFPVVYRALAGLDSLAQAAGRCNREGRLDRGELRVFVAETAPPKGVARQAMEVTRVLLQQNNHQLDLDDPETFRRYFELLYRVRSLDQDAIQEAREQCKFKSVAQSFHVVQNDWSAPVVIPCPEAKPLLKDLDFAGASRDRFRALQRYTVNVAFRDRQRWLDHDLAREIEGVVALLDDAAYDDRFGLVPSRVGDRDAASLIVDSLLDE
jgi:CRISPR-associated endonuclease/helicase Cas3